MRKLILKMQMSLDGFVAGPKGEIDWVFQTMAADAADWIVDTLWNAGVHIMGRKTFFAMAPHWPTSTWPYAAPMNAIPKLIFSRTGLDAGQKVELMHAIEGTRRTKQAEGVALPPDYESRERDWAEAPFATGDLTAEIARLKQLTGKPILAHGGAGFVRSLIAADLVDEYRLMVHPVVLGQGEAIFTAAGPAACRNPHLPDRCRRPRLSPGRRIAVTVATTQAPPAAS